ncbi:MAG TPA: hypothetical protein DDZ80_08425 [Cyanobacteria bacterium UBA8803]|nr:hypothetical protein [Cyanobacteria bacterium UBA9273]HBL58527.1 hypothetical protein [Cyanobacteria bacterium UBA8803]
MGNGGIKLSFADAIASVRLRSCSNVIKPVKARFLAIASTENQGFWSVIENGARPPMSFVLEKNPGRGDRGNPTGHSMVNLLFTSSSTLQVASIRNFKEIRNGWGGEVCGFYGFRGNSVWLSSHGDKRVRSLGILG